MLHIVSAQLKSNRHNVIRVTSHTLCKNLVDHLPNARTHSITAYIGYCTTTSAPTWKYTDITRTGVSRMSA